MTHTYLAVQVCPSVHEGAESDLGPEIHAGDDIIDMLRLRARIYILEMPVPKWLIQLIGASFQTALGAPGRLNKSSLYSAFKTPFTMDIESEVLCFLISKIKRLE